MHPSYHTLAMAGFIALVVIVGFFGPYLLSILLLALLGLCWIFPSKQEDGGDHSSGASTMGS